MSNSTVSHCFLSRNSEVNQWLWTSRLNDVLEILQLRLNCVSWSLLRLSIALFLTSFAVSLSLRCCFDTDSFLVCIVSSFSTNSSITDSSSTAIALSFSSYLIFLLNFLRRVFHRSRTAFYPLLGNFFPS